MERRGSTTMNRSAGAQSSSGSNISPSRQIYDSTNPISVIQSRLQLLRAERERTQSEVDSLELEKRSIHAILPRIMHELQLAREGLDFKYKELQIYNSAIQEIESIYGHVLFSPDIFDQQSHTVTLSASLGDALAGPGSLASSQPSLSLSNMPQYR